jgi:hypothetical protein
VVRCHLQDTKLEHWCHFWFHFLWSAQSVWARAQLQ